MESQIDPTLAKATEGEHVGKVLSDDLRLQLERARNESSAHGTAIEDLDNNLNERVISTSLNGFQAIDDSNVEESDNVLIALSKLQAQIISLTAQLDYIKPTLVSSIVQAENSSRVLLAFSEPLDITATLLTSAFAVSGHAIGGVGFIGNTTIYLDLTTPFTFDEASRSVSYNIPGNAQNRIKDLKANDAAGILGIPVVNNVQQTGDVTAPVIIAAVISNGEPNAIELTYNEPLNTTVTLPTAAFTVTGKVVASVSFSSSSALKVVFTTNFTNGQVVNVNYAVPGDANKIKDVAGNAAVALNNYAVTNNLQAALQTVKIISEGDSNTGGLGGTPYPTQALPILSSGYTFNLQNMGTSGISLLTLNSNYATRVGDKLDATKNINLVSIMAGINTSGSSDDEALEKFSLLRNFSEKVLETGFQRYIVGTYITRGGNDALWAGQIVKYNQIIRTFGRCELGADGIFDFAANTSFDSADDAYPPNYVDDRLHSSTAGNALLAPEYANLVNTVVANKPPLQAAPIFSPYWKFPNITLSNNNRSISVSTGAGSFTATSPNMRKSGKYYFEVEATNLSQQLHIGLVNKNFHVGAAPMGQVANNYSIGLAYSDGNVRLNNAVVATLGLTLLTGDIVGVAVDFDIKKIWFRRTRGAATTDWNSDPGQNPAAGSGGIDFSALGTGVIRAGVGIRTSPDVATARFASPQFSQAAPDGFSPLGGDNEMTAPVLTQAPVLSGTGVEGSTLTISTPSTATGTPAPNVSYQVRRNGTIVYGGTGTSYVVTAAVSGDSWDVVATIMNLAGEIISTSNTITTP